ncbi:MAG TPA: LD-carboxypeptidase [Bacteroidales bacterium]|jgi:muramoyltetrapeptide carboxypeptidase|nr:LD-carboxypeptidase [Bacteroidales bacterium]HKM12758.1 LD-carboxypeptidase [Bacteroidales bacterium]HPB88884.1 LD-carboxypeptidase [Bacteroidales bacterium]HPY21163.1 LD-carboxypeptidase [Bacteroidales bacterium]HQA92410.1 LD-carboxypeptidase [Bacteroidales bacterium]
MRQFIRPSYLKPGDTIGLVAMASAISESQLTPEYEEKWSSIFNSWGLKVKKGKHLYHSLPGDFAGEDAFRAEDICEMLLDDEIKAIISYRGGYGSMRTLSHLDLNLFREHPKWLVGFSDITIFHSALRSLGIESILGAMPSTFGEALPQTFDSLHNALFGADMHYSTAPHPFSKIGKCRGRLVGGNLCLFASTIGTHIQNLFEEDSILFIEDIDEKMHTVDRMLLTMRCAGMLDRLKGVIIGQFTDTADSDKWEKDVYTLIKEHTDRLDCPVLFGFPCGHEQPNYSLVLGREAVLEVSPDGGSLRLL